MALSIFFTRRPPAFSPTPFQAYNLPWTILLCSPFLHLFSINPDAGFSDIRIESAFFKFVPP